MTTQQPQALKIKKRYEKKWLRMEGVTAVGIGLSGNDSIIIVSVDGDADMVRQKIPAVVDRIAVKIELSGIIREQDE